MISEILVNEMGCTGQRSQGGDGRIPCVALFQEEAHLSSFRFICSARVAEWGEDNKCMRLGDHIFWQFSPMSTKEETSRSAYVLKSMLSS